MGVLVEEVGEAEEIGGGLEDKGIITVNLKFSVKG